MRILHINDIQFQQIKKISIFDNISESDIRRLLEFSSLEKYAADETIFHEKDKGSSLYIVVSGKVKIYRILPDNTSHEITNFTENEFFGEMSFMDNEARSANAISLCETLLINLTSDNFERFSQDNQSAAFRFHKNIISEIQSRLRRTNDRYSYHIIWGKTMKEALAKNYEELLQSNIELSESRNFLYNVINNSSEMIIVLNSSEAVVLFNSGASSNLGCQQAEIVNKRINLFFLENHYARILEMLEKDGAVYNFEANMCSSNGKKIIVSLSAFILNQEKNKKSRFGDGIVIMARNITDKKILERQILQNEKMIFLGKKLSEIIHDVRNPMTIIQLSADCLSYMVPQPPAEQVTEHIKKIENSIARIQKIIETTLDFAKVVPTSQEPLDLCLVIDRSISLAKANQKRDIDIIQNRSENCDACHIIGSASQLEQVFINLITNSMQAIPEGKHGIINIALEMNGTSDINVTIKDNGAGMPSEVIANIFDPFFTTKSSTGGTGLGLSICQAIISQHGGKITCESGPDEGTSFTIKLPARKTPR